MPKKPPDAPRERALPQETIDAMSAPNPSQATRMAYRQLLALSPERGRLGDLAFRATEAALIPAYDALPRLQEDIRFHLGQMRTALAGPNPSPLELLLVDVICASYHDHWQLVLTYRQKTKDGYTFEAMAQWERILTAKEARYLRAVETLARVRRMLNLQININMPGGQQVNVLQAH